MRHRVLGCGVAKTLKLFEGAPMPKTSNDNLRSSREIRCNPYVMRDISSILCTHREIFAVTDLTRPDPPKTLTSVSVSACSGGDGRRFVRAQKASRPLTYICVCSTKPLHRPAAHRRLSRTATISTAVLMSNPANRFPFCP